MTCQAASKQIERKPWKGPIAADECTRFVGSSLASLRQLYRCQRSHAGGAAGRGLWPGWSQWGRQEHDHQDAGVTICAEIAGGSVVGWPLKPGKGSRMR